MLHIWQLISKIKLGEGYVCNLLPKSIAILKTIRDKNIQKQICQNKKMFCYVVKKQKKKRQEGLNICLGIFNNLLAINQMATKRYLLFLCLFLTFLIQPTTPLSNCELDCCRTLSDRPPSTYTFYQNTGHFTGGNGASLIDTYGYSGHDQGYLNPTQECNLTDIGPLPASTYKLGYCKNIMHETTQRPCSFYLDPVRPEELCGRSDFFIHGCHCCSEEDDRQPPVVGCSDGCVVINYENRRKLRLGDILVVKQYEPKGQAMEMEVE